MEPITPDQIRRSLRNSSKSRTAAVTFPPDLESLEWETLDFLGWQDPRIPGRTYLAAPHRGALVAVELRAPDKAAGRPGKAMCAICHTSRPNDEVVLFAAPRAGAAGKAGNTVGTYMCEDLACSLLIRGIVAVEGGFHADPALVEDKITALHERLDGFLARILEP